MEPFKSHRGIVAVLDRANVDTDAIIPSREMKSVSKSGLAEGLFAGWRYTQIGGREPNPDFVLNQPAYAGAQILLAGENFGCGSSREHAVWALLEFGIRAILAPSFSPVFRLNCVRNGLLPVRLPPASIAALAESVATAPQARRITVDLMSKTQSGRFLHSMPLRRNVEADDAVVDGPLSLVIRQAGNRLHIQRALFSEVLA
jgi:3-isopropylmalate/(R)-2-methylmalate dehydratase small subunit